MSATCSAKELTSLADIAHYVSGLINPDEIKITVRREFVLDYALRAAKRTTFDVGKTLKVCLF